MAPRSRFSILDRGELPQESERLLDLPEIRTENFEEIFGDSTESILQFLARYKLIKNEIVCERAAECGGIVALSKDKKLQDGFMWRCTKCRGSGNDKRHSVRTNSFFFDHKLPIKQELFIMESWCNHPDIAEDIVAKSTNIHRITVSNYFELFRDITATWYERYKKGRLIVPEERTVKPKQKARAIYGIIESNLHGFMTEKCFRDYCNGEKVMNNLLYQIAVICDFEKAEMATTSVKCEFRTGEMGQDTSESIEKIPTVKSEPYSEEHEQEAVCSVELPVLKCEPKFDEKTEETPPVLPESAVYPELQEEQEVNDSRFLEFIRMPVGRTRVSILDIGEEPQPPSRLLDLPDIREENIVEIIGNTMEELLQFLARYKLIRNRMPCEKNCGGRVGLAKSKRPHDGYTWRCTRCRGSKNDKRHSVRTHSFFFDHKVPITQELMIMETWCNNPEVSMDLLANKMNVHRSSIANYFALFRDVTAVWMERTLGPVHKRMRTEEPTAKARQNARFLYGIRESKEQGIFAEQFFREHCRGGKAMNEFLRIIAEICDFEKMDLEKIEVRTESNYDHFQGIGVELGVFIKGEIEEEIGADHAAMGVEDITTGQVISVKLENIE